MGIAVASACFFTYRKLAYDGSLRLRRNPAQQHEDLSQYLTKGDAAENKEE